MDPIPHARYQIGIALDHDRVAVLADADCFALAQAKQIVIAQLLREGFWQAVVIWLWTVATLAGQDGLDLKISTDATVTIASTAARSSVGVNSWRMVPNKVKAVPANSTATRTTIQGASRQACRARL